jgi:hypothetical protein
MAKALSTRQKITGKIRALGRFVIILTRFVVHPGDFLRLYQRESAVADSVLDIAVMSLEQEFHERIAALEARVTELEGHGAVLPGPAE